MIIDVVLRVSDVEYLDLTIYDGIRLTKQSLGDDKSACMLVGFWADRDTEYPICFCKDYASGVGILDVVHQAVLTRNRIVDARECTVEPDADTLNGLRAAAATEQEAISRSGIEPGGMGGTGRIPVYKEPIEARRRR